MNKINNQSHFIFQPISFFTNVVKSLYGVIAKQIKAVGYMLSSSHTIHSLSGRTNFESSQIGSSSSTFSPSDSDKGRPKRRRRKIRKASDSSGLHSASTAPSKRSSLASQASDSPYIAKILSRLENYEKNGIPEEKRRVILEWLDKYTPSKKATSAEDIQLRSLFDKARTAITNLKGIEATPKKRKFKSKRGKIKKRNLLEARPTQTSSGSRSSSPVFGASPSTRSSSINEGQLSAQAAIYSGKVSRVHTKEDFENLLQKITPILEMGPHVQNPLTMVAIGALKAIVEAKKTELGF